mmetsp:Transcript_17398/g.41925  ORF Transcript_17398/g.41925 Transcript_17398/m.41925 type:complete len:272 (+) Transcript_17398:1173-1988(+)
MVGRLVEEEERGLREEGTAERHTHAPPAGKVLGLLLEEILRKAETHQDLRGAQLKRVRVHPVYTVVNVEEELVVRARGLAEVLRHRLQTLHLRLHDVDDSLERGAVRGLGLLVEVEDVHVLGERQLARSEARQERRLAAAVGPDETVALAVGQLERRVLDETLPVHLEREREDLQIARERVRAEHTCDVTRGLGLEVAHGPGGGFLPELLHHHCRLLHLKLDLVDSVILLVGLDGAALKLGLLLAFECARLLDLSSGHARISGHSVGSSGR